MTFYKNIIQNKIGKRVNLIDSSAGVAKKVRDFLKKNKEVENKLGKSGKFELFVSDITRQFEKTAKAVLKRNVKLEKVNMMNL